MWLDLILGCSFFTLILNASSCNGVRNISGVRCSSSFSKRAREHNVKQTPGLTRPARPFPAAMKQI